MFNGNFMVKLRQSNAGHHQNTSFSSAQHYDNNSSIHHGQDRDHGANSPAGNANRISTTSGSNVQNAQN